MSLRHNVWVAKCLVCKISGCKNVCLSKCTLPILAYNVNAITHTGDYAHIQVLTLKNYSTISKISFEGQFLRKNIQLQVTQISPILFVKFTIGFVPI